MVIAEQIRKMSPESATIMVTLLVSADLVFIFIHCLNLLTIKSNLLNIEHDRGYAEIYQYIKFFWIICLLSYLLIITKDFNFLSWIVVFGYLIIDDALSIHENFGGFIARYYSFYPLANLRPIDFGELVVNFIMGAFLLITIARSFLTGSTISKNISLDLLILIIILAFFGVIIDLAHVAIKLGVIFSIILGIVEDGGEMITTSIIFWYMFCLALRKGKPDTYLNDIKSNFHKPR